MYERYMYVCMRYVIYTYVIGRGVAKLRAEGFDILDRINTRRKDEEHERLRSDRLHLEGNGIDVLRTHGLSNPCLDGTSHYQNGEHG